MSTSESMFAVGNGVPLQSGSRDPMFPISANMTNAIDSFASLSPVPRGVSAYVFPSNEKLTIIAASGY